MKPFNHFKNFKGKNILFEERFVFDDKSKSSRMLPFLDSKNGNDIDLDNVFKEEVAARKALKKKVEKQVEKEKPKKQLSNLKKSINNIGNAIKAGVTEPEINRKPKPPKKKPMVRPESEDPVLEEQKDEPVIESEAEVKLASKEIKKKEIQNGHLLPYEDPDGKMWYYMVPSRSYVDRDDSWETKAKPQKTLEEQRILQYTDKERTAYDAILSKNPLAKKYSEQLVGALKEVNEDAMEEVDDLSDDYDDALAIIQKSFDKFRDGDKSDWEHCFGYKMGWTGPYHLKNPFDNDRCKNTWGKHYYKKVFKPAWEAARKSGDIKKAGAALKQLKRAIKDEIKFRRYIGKKIAKEYNDQMKYLAASRDLPKLSMIRDMGAEELLLPESSKGVTRAYWCDKQADKILPKRLRKIENARKFLGNFKEQPLKIFTNIADLKKALKIPTDDIDAFAGVSEDEMVKRANAIVYLVNMDDIFKIGTKILPALKAKYKASANTLKNSRKFYYNAFLSNYGKKNDQYFMDYVADGAWKVPTDVIEKAKEEKAVKLADKTAKQSSDKPGDEKGEGQPEKTLTREEKEVDLAKEIGVISSAARSLTKHADGYALANKNPILKAFYDFRFPKKFATEYARSSQFFDAARELAKLGVKEKSTEALYKAYSKASNKDKYLKQLTELVWAGLYIKNKGSVNADQYRVNMKSIDIGSPNTASFLAEVNLPNLKNDPYILFGKKGKYTGELSDFKRRLKGLQPKGENPYLNETQRLMNAVKILASCESGSYKTLLRHHLKGLKFNAESVDEDIEKLHEFFTKQDVQKETSKFYISKLMKKHDADPRLVAAAFYGGNVKSMDSAIETGKFSDSLIRHSGKHGSTIEYAMKAWRNMNRLIESSVPYRGRV